MSKFFALCVFLSVAWTANGNTPSLGSKDVSTSAEVDCSTLIYDMIDCLSYMTKGSNDTKPGGSCCSGYKTVVTTDPPCICSALSSSASLGIDIDMDRSRKLHTYCHIYPDPLDKCQAPTPGNAPLTPPNAPPSPPNAPPSPPNAPPPPNNPSTPPPKKPTPPTPGSDHSQVPVPAPVNSATTMHNIMFYVIIGMMIYKFI